MPVSSLTRRGCAPSTIRFVGRPPQQARGAARFGGSQGLGGRNRHHLFQAAGLRTRWFAFRASGSGRMIATKIASRLVLEGAGFDRHDPGIHSRNPVIHTTVRLRASGGSFGIPLVPQEPWIRSPPESTDSADASGREIRPGTARVRSSATVVSAGHTGRGRDSFANLVIPSGIRSKAECRACSTWLPPPPVVSSVGPESTGVQNPCDPKGS